MKSYAKSLKDFSKHFFYKMVQYLKLLVLEQICVFSDILFKMMLVPLNCL